MRSIFYFVFLTFLLFCLSSCADGEWEKHSYPEDGIYFSVPKVLDILYKKKNLSGGRVYSKISSSNSMGLSLTISLAYYPEMEEELKKIAAKISSLDLACPSGELIEKKIVKISYIKSGMIFCVTSDAKISYEIYQLVEERKHIVIAIGKDVSEEKIYFDNKKFLSTVQIEKIRNRGQ